MIVSLTITKAEKWRHNKKKMLCIFCSTADGDAYVSMCVTLLDRGKYFSTLNIHLFEGKALDLSTLAHWRSVTSVLKLSLKCDSNIGIAQRIRMSNEEKETSSFKQQQQRQRQHTQKMYTIQWNRTNYRTRR